MRLEIRILKAKKPPRFGVFAAKKTRSRGLRV
jgi:hypothetical protein